MSTLLSSYSLFSILKKKKIKKRIEKKRKGNVVKRGQLGGDRVPGCLSVPLPLPPFYFSKEWRGAQHSPVSREANREE
jgi:hypothetical protein